MQNLREKDLEKNTKNVLDCVLEYVTAPDEVQLAGMKAFLANEYPNCEVRLTTQKKETLGGGFILRAGSREFDFSTKGREEALKRTIDALSFSDEKELLEKKGFYADLYNSQFVLSEN